MMSIAKVIPLKRMPRSIGVFDYAIPESLVEDIKVGQLVVVPLRSKTIVGIVSEIIADKDAASLKLLESIINIAPILSQKQVDLIHLYAQLYGVSIGVMAAMLLPPIKKLKLKKVDITTVIPTKNTTDPQTYFYRYKDPQDRYLEIAKQIQPSSLFLFAKKSDLDDVYQSLPKADQDSIICWSSSLTEKEQFDLWFTIKNNPTSIVFGTRGAVFLPFNSLNHIYIDFEHSNQHKHWDQAPRFHAKDISRMLQEQFNCHITLYSFAPSVNTYYQVHKQTITSDLPALLPPTKVPTLIDMRNEEKERVAHLLSFPCEEALYSATGAIFILINKKGYSHGICCNECKHVFRCPTCRLCLVYHKKTQSLQCHYCHVVQSSLQKCPTCTSTERFTFGYGIEQLSEEIKNITKELDGYTHVVIDADTPPTFELTSKHIIVGTDAAFSFIPWDITSTIIFANIDQTLQVPEYNASEHAYFQMQQVLFFCNRDAKFYIQTFNPDHVLLKRLYEPDYFYRMDLNLRRALQYPPYGDLVRYFFGHRDIRVVKTAAFAMHDSLQKSLTKHSIRAKISSPTEMHPKWYRAKFWYTIVIKSEPEDWQKNLLWLNKQFSDNWKVDPNPSSLLHP